MRDQAVEQKSLMDFVVSRGLETAFARDVGGAVYPWAAYPPDVAGWVIELQALPENAPLGDWMRRHPDGRRWIGVKAGTYLVDRAVRASGKTATELVSTSTEDVLLLAQ